MNEDISIYISGYGHIDIYVEANIIEAQKGSHDQPEYPEEYEITDVFYGKFDLTKLITESDYDNIKNELFRIRKLES